MTNRIAWLAALIPDAVETKSGYEEVLRRARKLIDTKNRGSTELRTYGVLLYRAGQHQGAIGFLNRSIRDTNSKGAAFDYLFLAMASHRLGQSGDRAALKRATELAQNAPSSWEERVQLKALMDEAGRELDAARK